MNKLGNMDKTSEECFKEHQSTKLRARHYYSGFTPETKYMFEFYHKMMNQTQDEVGKE